MTEIWKDINGYDGDYSVSTYGRVKSKKSGVDHILSQTQATGGYLYVWLSKDGKVSSRRVHRLVAMAFIPNPNSNPQVNHKDENRRNNHVENLEWCSPLYNANYGLRGKRISDRKNKAVAQISVDTGAVIRTFKSGKEAAEVLGLLVEKINACCRGERQTHGGYRWKRV